VRLLLDTHIALWAITDNPRLPGEAKLLIQEQRNEIFVSAASVWEIAIKHSLGRGVMPISGQEALKYFTESGYRLLSISAIHAALVEELPQYHADPFDRILVAQARHEPMRLITHDSLLSRYGESVHMV
jgi:PIN domain nuclease of toxin-antitoxin system